MQALVGLRRWEMQRRQGYSDAQKAERDADSSRTSVPGPKIEPAKMCLTKCIMHPRHSYLSPRPVGA